VKMIKCVQVMGKIKSVLGYQETLFCVRLPRTGVSLRLPRYRGQPKIMEDKSISMSV
jgi:hypothetical protein